MSRCSEEESNKNARVAALFVQQGIDFVPMPVTPSQSKEELIAQMTAALDELDELEMALPIH